MHNETDDRVALIGCAIGTAVVTLIANGVQVSRENILNELERMKSCSGSTQVKIISAAAAEILRRRRDQSFRDAGSQT